MTRKKKNKVVEIMSNKSEILRGFYHTVAFTVNVISN